MSIIYLSVCVWVRAWAYMPTGAPASSVAYVAPPHFSTLSHKRHDFRQKQNVLNIKFVFISSPWKFYHSEKNSARHYRKVTQVFMWSTRYTSRNLNQIISTYFQKNPQSQILYKSVHWGPSYSTWTNGRATQRLSVTSLILSVISRDIIINLKTTFCTLTVIFVTF
jgi:hypothetical protein